jgi:hypothetical protein
LRLQLVAATSSTSGHRAIGLRRIRIERPASVNAASGGLPHDDWPSVEAMTARHQMSILQDLD